MIHQDHILANQVWPRPTYNWWRWATPPWTNGTMQGWTCKTTWWWCKGWKCQLLVCGCWLSPLLMSALQLHPLYCKQHRTYLPSSCPAMPRSSVAYLPDQLCGPSAVFWCDQKPDIKVLKYYFAPRKHYIIIFHCCGSDFKVQTLHIEILGSDSTGSRQERWYLLCLPSHPILYRTFPLQSWLSTTQISYTEACLLEGTFKNGQISWSSTKEGMFQDGDYPNHPDDLQAKQTITD